MTNTITTTNTTTSTDTTTTTAFDQLKRNFETAYLSGGYADEITALASAITSACLNKCIDPQRTTAPQRGQVSDNGHSPALVGMRQGLYKDLRLLSDTAWASDTATVATGAGRQETLSDGLDLVHDCMIALLEQAEKYNLCPNWLDMTITEKRLSKRVYIQRGDTAHRVEVETTPIQDVYRTIRGKIQGSRAVQVASNKYCYLEDVTADGVDTIYFRLSKYADLGGLESRSFPTHTGGTRGGQYTVNLTDVDTVEAIKTALDLTAGQGEILALRLQGYGYKAIATYRGVTPRAIVNTMEKIQAKAVKIGFTPDGWEAWASTTTTA